MKQNLVGIMIFGESPSDRNALTEEKYRGLASAFATSGFRVNSVVYNDTLAQKLAKELPAYDAILVWVNPIEQGTSRNILDALLVELSEKGCYVSAHPEAIVKIGTKDILYKTRGMECGGDVQLYQSFEDFGKQFLDRSKPPTMRILKQHRGNGGNGVFKIDTTRLNEGSVGITHAKGEDGERRVAIDDFLNEMKSYFAGSGVLIDQEWNPNLINGMVRCYLTGTKVTGFGYQEINALFPESGTGGRSKTPSKRFYFSEECGLFQDLRVIMESSWVPHLQRIVSLGNDRMPAIWDADFFINNVNTDKSGEKYTLCEINVSCVSPFPESAIPHIVENVTLNIEARKRTVAP
jgi:hypothetical protein